MKLVAAKCPNCGASIEVNEKSETTKCKYCQQAILIEDAIAKYKLEISGEVEIKNLPKIDNYLKKANRNFKEKNYDEAYKDYNEVLTLDPDNTLALIRYSICKTYLNNGIDFILDHLLTTFKNVVELLKKQEKYDEVISDYINDTCKVVDDSRFSTIEYYNSYSVTRTELADIQTKLYSCLEVYQELYNHANKEKDYISEQIVSTIDDLISKKKYKTGFDGNGNRVNQSFSISIGEKHRLQSLRKNYSNDEEFKNDNSNIVKKSTKFKLNRITATQGWSIFIGLLVIGAIGSNDYAPAVPLIILIIYLNIDKSKYKVFKKYTFLNIIIIVALVIITGLLMN